MELYLLNKNGKYWHLISNIWNRKARKYDTSYITEKIHLIWTMSSRNREKMGMFIGTEDDVKQNVLV